MDDATYERIRARFWHWTKIDLNALDIDEARELLTFLPMLMMALHQRYQTRAIYGKDIDTREIYGAEL